MRPGIAIVLIVAAAACSPTTTLGQGEDPLAATVLFTTDTGEVRVNFLRFADTPEARAHGLMGIEDLAKDEGMLFVYGEPTQGGFWMKDTLIPLDIAFWGEDGLIHTITRMAPCDLGDDCPEYVPDEPYIAALEMNAGWFAHHGVEEGDRADGRLVSS
ncbi:MAG: DUF192 domain-containing protein [Actinomycetota bacterium]